MTAVVMTVKHHISAHRIGEVEFVREEFGEVWISLDAIVHKYNPGFLSRRRLARVLAGDWLFWPPPIQDAPHTPCTPDDGVMA